MFDSNYNINASDCKKIINSIKNIERSVTVTFTFGEYLEKLFSIIDNDSICAKSLKKKIFGYECSLDDIKQIFDENINSKDENTIYELKFLEFQNWYNYILEKNECHNVDKISLIAYNTFIQININFYICGNNINN